VETALTVREAIKLLVDCDPDAYIMLDDNGIGREFVEIAGGNKDGNYFALLADGNEVRVVYLILRGEIAEGERMVEAMQSYQAEKISQTAALPIHPSAMIGNKSGAFDLSAGDRFIYSIDGRHGRADEFLQDGDAFVTFDDGTYDTIKWNHMVQETKID
jgi:hypothetical protein